MGIGWSIYITRLQGVKAGYRGLQGVTGCDSRLRDVTGDYKGIQKTCSLTRKSPDTFSWYIFRKRVTRGYRVFQGVTGDYKGLQWIISGDRRLQGVTVGDGITMGYRGLQ